MYKFVMFMLLIVFQMMMMAVQLDEERAMHMLFELKHGVNRAAHAAAQQVDEDLLAQGVWSIDEEGAEETALQYLQANLLLDEDNAPLPESLLREPVSIALIEIINADRHFPYRYVNEVFNYDVTLERPGVIIIIQAEYPRIYRLINPITWMIKGTSELYEP